MTLPDNKPKQHEIKFTDTVYGVLKFEMDGQDKSMPVVTKLRAMDNFGSPLTFAQELRAIFRNVINKTGVKAR